MARRNRWIGAGVAVAMLVATLLVGQWSSSRDRADAVGEVIRIMPLGDSITIGSGVEHSYRGPLQQLLSQGGYSFDFVGSYGNVVPPGGQDTWAWPEEVQTSYTGPLDIDFEGHGGFQAGQPESVVGYKDHMLAQMVPTDIPLFQPDVVIMHIGTNDYLGGWTKHGPWHGPGGDWDNRMALSSQNVIDLIDQIHGLRPETMILVSPIGGAALGGIQEDLAEFSGIVRDAVAVRAGQGRNVGFIDGAYDSLQTGDLSDGLHLTDAGSTKLANAIYTRLAPVLDGMAGTGGAEPSTTTAASPAATTAPATTAPPTTAPSTTAATDPSAPVTSSLPPAAVPTDGVVLEAEDPAVDSNLPVIAEAGGFTGQGYRSSWGPAQTMPGQYVQWTVDAPAAGEYPLEVRYSNGGYASQRALSVNGQVADARLSFPATASRNWDQWATLPVAVPLQEGENTVRVEYGSGSVNYMLFDSLQVPGNDTPQPSDEVPTTTTTVEPTEPTSTSSTIEDASPTTEPAPPTTEAPSPPTTEAEIPPTTQTPTTIAAEPTTTTTAPTTATTTPATTTTTTTAPTTSAPAAAVYEAEDAGVDSNMPVGADAPGFSGSGFRVSEGWFLDLLDGYIEWTVTVPAEGRYTLDFRFDSGGYNSSRMLIVNDEVARSRVRFRSAGVRTADRWAQQTTTVRLQPGENTVRLEFDLFRSRGPVLLDSLTVRPRATT